MSLPTIYGLTDLQEIISSAYGVAAGTPANVGAGSQYGPSFNAASLAMLLIQNENVYIDSISRLGSMQDPLPNGDPNPDVDTFINAFNFFRLGAQPANGYVTCTIPSPAGSNGFLIPVGAIASPNGGPYFICTAGGTGYNNQAGGYVIPPGQSSIAAYFVCTVGGSVGNVLPNAITNVIVQIGQPPAGFTVNNPTAFTNGVATEVGQTLKNRFALYISGGGAGTPNAILAAASGVQSGLTLSYGDQVKGHAGGSGVWTSLTPNTESWFSLIVANAGSGADPGDGGTLANLISTALMLNVRPAGISFIVAYPQLTTISGSGQINVLPGFDKPTVVAAVQAAFTSFVNNLNMNQYGAVTVCSIMQTYVALSSVPGVAYIDTLELNGGTSDIVMNFGYMASAGSTTGFVAA